MHPTAKDGIPPDIPALLAKFTFVAFSVTSLPEEPLSASLFRLQRTRLLEVHRTSACRPFRAGVTSWNVRRRPEARGSSDA